MFVDADLAYQCAKIFFKYQFIYCTLKMECSSWRGRVFGGTNPNHKILWRERGWKEGSGRMERGKDWREGKRKEEEGRRKKER